MCFAPASLDPRSLRQQLFGSVLIRFPAVVYKLTLLLQLFTDPSSCHVQDATPGPQIEKALSVHIGPSVAEPGNSAPGHRWALPFPPAPPWRAVPSVFPQLSVGALDHYEYPHHHRPPPPSCECRNVSQSRTFCPRTSISAVPSSRIVSSDSLRAPVSPHLRQQSPAPNFFFFSFIFISWRLITLQYCSGFCHTLT